MLLTPMPILLVLSWSSLDGTSSHCGKLILPLLAAGKLGGAFKLYRFVMDGSDEAAKNSLRAWILTISTIPVFCTFIIDTHASTMLTNPESPVIFESYGNLFIQCISFFA
ncbi:hypothetical protein C8R48DRAFT_679030 [Suillus tomentosus]|nr:hypothetical protein C8R48DRAFT_679030 [Suillus tomentosus]